MCHGTPHFCGLGRQLRDPDPRNDARSGDPASIHARPGCICTLTLTLGEGVPIVLVMEAAKTQTTAPIVLTPKAVEMVKSLRAKEGRPEGHALRVAVVGGGCSGFSYQLSFEDAPQEADQVVEYDGIQVLVDPTSAQYLEGTEIDFVSSLHGSGFKFSNPKATQTCGCGSSFTA